MVECNDFDRYTALTFWDAFEENEDLWISNVTFNGLFRIDLNNYISEFIIRFEGEINSKGLHKQIISFGDTLIFIPELAQNVAFFNKIKGTMEYVSIEMSNSKKGETKAAGAKIYNNQLWIFPQYISQDIIIVDLFTKSVRQNSKLKEFILNGKMDYSELLFGLPVFMQDEVWIPLKNTNFIIQFKMLEEKVQQYSLSYKKLKINGLSCDDDGEFIITFLNTTDILKWNPRDVKEELIPIDVEWNGKSAPFSCVLRVYGNQYLILPAHTENILLLEGRCITQLPYPSGFHWIDDFKVNWTRYGVSKRKRDEIYILPAVGNMMLVYNIASREMKGFVCRTPKGWDDEYIYNNIIVPDNMKERFRKFGVVKENNEYKLQTFLSHLNLLKKESATQQYSDYGSNIFNTIKLNVK